MNDASPGAGQKDVLVLNNQGAATPPPAPEPEVSQVAPAARMKRRHWGLVSSFVALVLLPLAVIAVYLWAIALDQYSSVTGFTVRQEETGNASELLGGLAALTGSSTAADGDILYEFMFSQALIRAVDEKVGIREHYAERWSSDPVFALWPDASIEDLEWYWQRIVRISLDRSSGLIDVRVLAFSPEKAQEITAEILAQSQEMINALNVQAREDAMRYALIDLGDAVKRLKEAREALTKFRTTTQIVDPEADIQGRMGVLNNLQQQLAEALISFDLLSETTSSEDPRMAQALRRIEVIRERILRERENFSTDGAASGHQGEDYPRLIAVYEGLVVDREFAEETYRAALTALGHRAGQCLAAEPVSGDLCFPDTGRIQRVPAAADHCRAGGAVPAVELVGDGTGLLFDPRQKLSGNGAGGMIRFENLTKSFRVQGTRKIVIDNLNMELPTGQSLALLGRNGAGKSTLLQMVAGTMRPDSGRVVSDGSISWPVGFGGSFSPRSDRRTERAVRGPDIRRGYRRADCVRRRLCRTGQAFPHAGAHLFLGHENRA